MTPLSVGTAQRTKTNWGCERMELRGDNINNDLQIRSLALLLGAYDQAIKQGEKPPFRCPDQRHKNNIGRAEPVWLSNEIALSRKKEITAQQYMEAYFEWLEPYFKVYGTKEEVQTLAEFVYHDRDLTIDQRKLYAAIKHDKLKTGGEYTPSSKLNNVVDSPILRFDEKVREAGVEGKLLAHLLSNEQITVDYMEWDYLEYIPQGQQIAKKKYSTNTIYEFAEQLSEKNIRRPARPRKHPELDGKGVCEKHLNKEKTAIEEEALRRRTIYNSLRDESDVYYGKEVGGDEA